MYGAKLQRLILRKQSGGMNILGGGGVIRYRQSIKGGNLENLQPSEDQWGGW